MREKDEEEPLTVGSRMENDEEEKEQVEAKRATVVAATMEETEEGEEDARSEGLRYITRQLPDATVRTNCARGT